MFTFFPSPADESEHPYENPTLIRKLNKNQQQIYADLQGHSLPHHYQGLGQHAQLNKANEESPYDELATESTNGSGFYFKLDSNMNDDTLKSNSQSSARGGKTVSPYEQVVIGNYASNNAKKSQENCSTADERNPHYFVLGSSNNSSHGSTGSVSVDDRSESRPRDKDGGEQRQTVADAKPPIAAKPTLAAPNAMAKSSSYDRLDRAVIHEPNADDIDSNDYNKLFPVLAGQSAKALSMESLDYMKVRSKNDSVVEIEIDDDGEFNVESDYNKLDRGVEREMGNLKETDEEHPVDIERHSIASDSSEIPIEL